MKISKIPKPPGALSRWGTFIHLSGHCHISLDWYLTCTLSDEHRHTCFEALLKGAEPLNYYMSEPAYDAGFEIERWYKWRKAFFNEFEPLIHFTEALWDNLIMFLSPQKVEEGWFNEWKG